jgi:hypothetical protein
LYRKIKIITSGLLLTAVLLVSCTKNFVEMNTNPNNPVSVPAISIFTNAIVSSVNLELGSWIQHSVTGLWCQQWARILYPAGDRYQLIDISGYFNRAYTEGLKNLNIVIKKSREEGNSSLLAAAKILRVWDFMYLTDLFGDVPYSEALQGLTEDGTLHPKYDTQKSIYTDLLAELEEANILLAGTTFNFGIGDLIYSGDPLHWRKFANSLRLRILNRAAGTPWSFAYDMAGTQPDVTTAAGPAAIPEADAGIAEILADPSQYPVFESNDDNAKLVYLGMPYRNPIFTYIYAQAQQGISETMVDWLKARNDPRLHIYAQPTANSVSKPPLDYTGFQNGRAVSGAPLLSVSLLGTKIAYIETAPAFIMCYDEVLFIKAEYYKRTGNDAEARAAYEQGIRASMARWGLYDGGVVNPEWGDADHFTTSSTSYPVDYATYLAHPFVAWNSAANDPHKFQLICEQKWAAMYGQGVQAYSEVRRTGFPERIFEYELEGTYYPDMGLPIRLPYPLSETALNTVQLDAAKKYQNIELSNDGMFSTNGVKSQVWWHTRKNPIPTETDIH